ncbi:MAG: hypothetical protein RLZZ369_538, partial [Pseudomonadota bacterium]
MWKHASSVDAREIVGEKRGLVRHLARDRAGNSRDIQEVFVSQIVAEVIATPGTA